MNFREKLIEKFKIIFKRPELDEVFFLLSAGNYYIEFSYEIHYSLNNQDYDGSVPFGYIYDGRFFAFRDDFYAARNSTKRNFILNSTQISKDISNISRNLETLYGRALFNDIQQIMNEYNKYLSKQIEINTNEEFVFIQTYVKLEVCGIMVLGIDYEEHDPEIDSGITDTDRIMKLLNIDNNLLLLPEQHWFNDLSSDSKLLIRAGTQYLQQMYFTKKKEEIIDYAPLLFNFIKCLELEIIEHYKKFFSNIIRNAKMIVESKTNMVDYCQISEFHRNKLKKISNDIITFRERFKPNGIHTFYYILKYFALSHNLSSIDNYTTYLPEDKFNILKNENKLLERLQHLGIDRNRYIHEKFIDSENEFIMVYNDIVLILKLLSVLNN